MLHANLLLLPRVWGSLCFSLLLTRTLAGPRAFIFISGSNPYRISQHNQRAGAARGENPAGHVADFGGVTASTCLLVSSEEETMP